MVFCIFASLVIFLAKFEHNPDIVVSIKSIVNTLFLQIFTLHIEIFICILHTCMHVLYCMCAYIHCIHLFRGSISATFSLCKNLVKIKKKNKKTTTMSANFEILQKE